MHIEPGILLAPKVFSANIAAVALVGLHLRLYLRPMRLVHVPHILSLAPKIVLAALFFSIFMQIFHMEVGYSELHFIGASVIYFTFGLTPTFLGFAFGLLLQGVFFDPQDLYHLGVNSLTLMMPLLVAHSAFGRKITKNELSASYKPHSFIKISSFDALFHSGVVVMVGFWLLLGEESVMLKSWAQFAVSYIPVVALDSFFAWAILNKVVHLSPSHPAFRWTWRYHHQAHL